MTNIKSQIPNWKTLLIFTACLGPIFCHGNSTYTSLPINSTNLQVAVPNFWQSNSSAIGSAVADPRKTTNVYVAPNLTNNVATLLFTNNGPCTICSLHAAYSVGAVGTNNPVSATQTTNLLNSIFTFYCDGVSNSVRYSSLFACWNLTHPYHTDRIANSTVAWINGIYTGAFRKHEINCFTNIAIYVTSAVTSTNTLNLIWQVEYKPGTPVCSSYRNRWHILDITTNLAVGNTFSNSMFTTNEGEVEMFEENAQGASADALYYVNAFPTWYIDGAVYANSGTEDTFGSTWNFNNGGDWYVTEGCGGISYNPQICAVINAGYAPANGYVEGALAWRWYPGVGLDNQQIRLLVTNSLAFTRANVSSQTMNMTEVFSWWTQN